VDGDNAEEACFQYLEKLNLTGCAEMDIFATDDQIDAMSNLVALAGKLIGPLSLPVAYGKISPLVLWILPLLTEFQVLENGLPFQGPETNRIALVREAFISTDFGKP
jgi:hypothetical protein